LRPAGRRKGCARRSWRGSFTGPGRWGWSGSTAARKTRPGEQGRRKTRVPRGRGPVRGALRQRATTSRLFPG
jgi:hypothetical protein